MKISVCMIVKNEEEVLKRCLDCVKQFADEIIIVDTGSIDTTKEIAKKYTDKVYDFEWVNDFSKARNFSFKFAKCDYIMWLDADDFLTQDDILKINNLKKTEANCDVYMLKYEIGFDSLGRANFSYYRERIIKNNGKFFWSGFIHEAIPVCGKVEYLDIAIKHKRKQKTDKTRNLNIYLNQIKNGATLTPRDRFYFAREYFYNGKYTKAKQEFKKFLLCENKFLPNVIEANLFIAKCFLMLGKTQKAKEQLFKSLLVVDIGAEGCCLLGEIFLKEKKYNLAIFWFRSALNQVANENGGGFVDKTFFTITPCLQLTYVYYLLGDIKTSIYYHEMAKSFDPKNLTVLHNDMFFNSK